MVRTFLRSSFPNAPCYDHFLTLQPRIMAVMTMFMTSKSGRKSGVYYIDSTPLPVCHNLRINRHKTFDGLAAKGKTPSWGYFINLYKTLAHKKLLAGVIYTVIHSGYT